MRVIEVPGRPGGHHDDAEQPPPTMIGPAVDSDDHHFGSRLRDTLAARHARQAAHTEDERLADSQLLHSARKAGGKHTEMYLTGLLDDDWMLIRGYQNPAGGIGQVLVSTHGVVAMTSLHLDATVHCHGDKWRAERFDHHSGQSIGETHLVDQSGHSPSAQLNQAADALEHFLHSSGVEAKVLRVVLLNHPRSRVENSVRPAVHVFASPYDLARWLKELPKTLDRAGRRRIGRLLTGSEHQDA